MSSVSLTPATTVCWRLVLLVSFLVACVPFVRAQEGGIVTGLVVSTWNGEPLSAVVITVRGTTLATQTDTSGRYQLDNVPPGDQVLRFSKSGFASAVVTDVRVLLGLSTTVNGNLRPEFYEIEEYEVTAAEFTEQTEQIMFERQQSSALLEAVGSDFLSKAGAGDAAEAMSKVTGVTVVDGKYVFVRGLGERYGLTTLNGAEVPSADPDKRAVQMDIFPSDSIERIETSKTFTPDQPGSFSGGKVNIVTKRFPKEFFFNVGMGTAYNTKSTFNDDFLTYDGGSKDWAGFDDGTRAIPKEWAEPALGRSEDLLSQTRSGGGRTPASRRAAADELIRTTDVFDDQMSPYKDAPPPDLSFSAATGNKVNLFSRPFGYLVAVNYDRKFRFYDDGFVGSYQAGIDSMKPLKELTDVKASQQTSWGSLVSLAYELNENHEIAFNFLFNRSSEDEAIYRYGFDDDVPDDLLERYILHYTERELRTFQLQGKHEFPQAWDMRTEWSAAYSGTSQNEPDYRIFEFVRDEQGQTQIPSSSVLEPTRFFRNIDEDNLNLKLDQSIPFASWGENEGLFKVGVFHSGTERRYEERRFAYNSNTSPKFRHFFQSGDPGTFLASENLTYTPTTFGAYQFNAYAFEKPYTEYDGSLDVEAAYAMIELPLLRRLKLTGGARYELSDLSIDSRGEYERSSDINEKDLLPSVGLNFEVMTNMNVRLAYGKTLARPTFREIGPPFFDFVNEEIIVGNPDLKQTSIDNFDLRWEWFRRPGEVLAASVFYKILDQPIEKTIVTRNDQVQYQNRDQATIFGFELEARTQLDLIDPLFEHFNVGANFTWIESEVDASQFEYDNYARGKDTRQLQGQSPYIINADITWSHPELGTTASLFYNVFGARLSEVSAISPNIFEQPVHTIDFILSQKLGKHTTLKFAAKNLLDPAYKKTIEYQGEEYIYRSYEKGRTFSLSLGVEW